MSKIKLTLWLALFGLFSPILEAANIHVLLEKNAREALLEVRGPYYLHDPLNDAKISSGLLAKRFLVRSTEDGLKWGQEFIGIHQIRITPRNKETALLLNGIQYHGSIAIYKIGNTIKIINEVDVEDYLKSVLTDNFWFSPESEALNATAIVLRTNAYFQIMQNKNFFWHVDGKNTNYNGAALIIPDSAVVSAVDATRDLILV
ncbi:MAG: SpoIID/LytB domain-containing protein, partial [Parachlamydiales bacterium]